MYEARKALVAARILLGGGLENRHRYREMIVFDTLHRGHGLGFPRGEVSVHQPAVQQSFRRFVIRRDVFQPVLALHFVAQRWSVKNRSKEGGWHGTNQRPIKDDQFVPDPLPAQA